MPSFATVGVASSMPTPLMDMLRADAIEPGQSPAYQTCKLIYEHHPIGKKMVDAPISIAMSQPREISVGQGANNPIPKMVVDAFVNTWNERRADFYVANLKRVSRIYGMATAVLVIEGQNPNEPFDLASLSDGAVRVISFNVLDPLNTAGGSTTINQDPNTIGFQRVLEVIVAGKAYHPTRACVILNEAPLYLSWTSSAYGFTGRSVYQRALYPLKSFLQGMRTDDLITRKVGVIVAKVKQAGTIIDNVMAMVIGQKRNIAKEAETDDVISIDTDEFIESLNLQNLDAPYALARKHVLENCALAADMPAKLLNQETFAEGFGEGTEDAKAVARYIDNFRSEMAPIFEFLDPIIQRLAWTPDFFESVQKAHPEQYAGKDFTTAFYEWKNAFRAVWPNLLTEPDSEKIKVDDVRLKGLIAVAQVILPELDPENKATMIEWLMDNLNDMDLVVSRPLLLDIDALMDYVPPMPGMGGLEDGEAEPSAPQPFSARDSISKRDRQDRAVIAFSGAVGAALATRERTR